MHCVTCTESEHGRTWRWRLLIFVLGSVDDDGIAIRAAEQLVLLMLVLGRADVDGFVGRAGERRQRATTPAATTEHRATLSRQRSGEGGEVGSGTGGGEDASTPVESREAQWMGRGLLRCPREALCRGV